jgi:hypothetical protein
MWGPISRYDPHTQDKATPSRRPTLTPVFRAVEAKPEASPEKKQPVGKLLPMRELVDVFDQGRDRQALRTDAQLLEDYHFKLKDPLRAPENAAFDRPGLKGVVRQSKIVLPTRNAGESGD